METLTLTTRHLSALCAELGTGAVYISNFSQAGVRTTFIFTNNILIEEFATLIVHSNLNCCSFADLGSADAALYLVKWKKTELLQLIKSEKCWRTAAFSWRDTFAWRQFARFYARLQQRHVSFCHSRHSCYYIAPDLYTECCQVYGWSRYTDCLRWFTPHSFCFWTWW